MPSFAKGDFKSIPKGQQSITCFFSPVAAGDRISRPIVLDSDNDDEKLSAQPPRPAVQAASKEKIQLNISGFHGPVGNDDKDSDDDEPLAVTRRARGIMRKRAVVLDDDSDDGGPIAPPRKRIAIVHDDDNNDEKPLTLPRKAAKSQPNPVATIGQAPVTIATPKTLIRKGVAILQKSSRTPLAGWIECSKHLRGNAHWSHPSQFDLVTFGPRKGERKKTCRGCLKVKPRAKATVPTAVQTIQQASTSHGPAKLPYGQRSFPTQQGIPPTAQQASTSDGLVTLPYGQRSFPTQQGIPPTAQQASTSDGLVTLPYGQRSFPTQQGIPPTTQQASTSNSLVTLPYGQRSFPTQQGIPLTAQQPPDEEEEMFLCIKRKPYHMAPLSAFDFVKPGTRQKCTGRRKKYCRACCEFPDQGTYEEKIAAGWFPCRIGGHWRPSSEYDTFAFGVRVGQRKESCRPCLEGKFKDYALVQAIPEIRGPIRDQAPNHTPTAFAALLQRGIDQIQLPGNFDLFKDRNEKYLKDNSTGMANFIDAWMVPEVRDVFLLPEAPPGSAWLAVQNWPAVTTMNWPEGWEKKVGVYGCYVHAKGEPDNGELRIGCGTQPAGGYVRRRWNLEHYAADHDDFSGRLRDDRFVKHWFILMEHSPYGALGMNRDEYDWRVFTDFVGELLLSAFSRCYNLTQFAKGEKLHSLSMWQSVPWGGFCRSSPMSEIAPLKSAVSVQKI